MTLEIRRPETLEYTHVRVFKETHQQLMRIGHPERASLPRVIEALVVYYLEAQEAEELQRESSAG